VATACTFRLDGKLLSVLSCPGVGDFPAFSGTDKGRNQPGAVGEA